LDHLFCGGLLASLFDGVYGSELDGNRSVKGDLISYIIERESLSASTVVMVGDSEALLQADRLYDIVGAKKNNIAAIGVTYGYGSREELETHKADLIADCPDEIATLLQTPRLIIAELMPDALLPLICYLNSRKGQCSGISFIDSMGIPICHNKRAKRNKVFRGLSGWGKSSVDWYFGFKLHLIINEQGELLAFQVTPGNVDDRKPVPTLAQNLWGRLFGDKGYISKSLFQKILENDVKLITPFKKNMKNKLVELWEKFMLRKRALIETVNDQLWLRHAGYQNISQVVHSRHRSISNFMVNIIAVRLRSPTTGLIAYTWQDKKPSLKLDKHEVTSLPALLI
jgi:hypothetical protein